MAMAPDDLDLMHEAINADPDLAAFFEDQKNCSYYQFKPRPNRPEKWDEQEAFIKNRDMVSFLVGGNACLAADSLIYDPVDGSHVPICDRLFPFHVLGNNLNTGQVSIQEASPAFCKGPARSFIVRLSTGAHFEASADHRVLTSDGWKAVFAELHTGDSLVRLGGGYSKVHSIRESGKHEVWDFECLPDHNYLHAGVIHHNSGTTVAGCAKLANMVFNDDPPPRHNAPIWIISNTYEQVCSVIWDEKLYGQGFIPDVEIDWPNVKWLSRKDGWPMRVPLKPWPGRPGKNFVLEFKSFEQGRSAMQARSIFGAFFSEQFPLNIFLEVLRGHRDYHKPGRFFAEFTPIDPDLCIWLETAMDKPPEGWKFYRCNTELNRENLSEGWFDEFFATVSPEARETRMTGALATFEGVIYQGFNQAIHVIEPDDIEFPSGAKHYMGVDWGAGGESPFHVVWAYRDGAGCFVFYDEYRSNDQTKTVEDHAATIVERCQGWGWPVVLSSYNMGELVINNKGSSYGVAFCDPSRPTDINLFAAHGVPSQPAMNAVLPGIECVRTLLKYNAALKQPKLLISKDCKILIEEMRKYRWKQGSSPADGVRKNYSAPNPEPQKYADHAVDCCRYLAYSVERTHGATISSMTDKAYIDDKHSINLKRGGSRMASRVQMNRTKSGRGGGMSIGNRLTRQDGWFLKK